MTVVVHSFVADSSLLDSCDLVGFVVVVFSHLMLAGRQPFGVLRWFQLFCFFHLVSAWLGQPFFVCHQHLWFGLSFFATGICGLFFLSLPQAFVYSLCFSRPVLP